ncbi:nucleotidyl transferase AbiEii/AbiGii toxin family protein [uncultured Bacteroides sp.]|uniref:nucleotidyl transferase AbiEii/AbiGii toxin family protein n=1 Tax=uncultured Bacteroides sp. TaxID=162156 RepID=UPI0025E914DF|nr:nucleotidyl transferase AbiEii/AbiGii toxin family protein [uncultured Bacteroides sp.]
MLHTETVAQSTLELLKNLESEDTLSGFNLAGGTALSLYLGHRVSVDLDLFTSKLKDFIDIAYLSTQFSFYSMLKLYERKFPDSNVIRLLKTITYFDDIDFDEDIIMLNSKYNWEQIEKRLIDMTKEQKKIFTSYPLPSTIENIN